MLPKRSASIAAILALVLLTVQCGKDEGPTQTPPAIDNPVDSIPPAAITDLLARNPSYTTVYLLWTAPGDDGMEGTAASYDIRYLGEPITDLNWDDAVPFVGEPAPKTGGQLETVNINGLDGITTYFFAVKTTDDEGNISALSNSASETTLNESWPPVAVTDLSADAVDTYSFLLTWTAPGDDGIAGTASEYDIRYSMQPITQETWVSATKVNQPPAPRPGGEAETLLVSKMRSPANFYFAMMAADEVPNWSEMSNVAFGMGYSVKLTLPEHHVQVGEELRILFRAPGEEMVWINLNQYAVIGCDPFSAYVKDNIVWGTQYPEGVHEIYYDFKTDQGEYLPPATYYVVLCWGNELQTSAVVYLEAPH